MQDLQDQGPLQSGQRRGFSWFSIQAGLVAPIFLLELVLTSPTYRGNILTFLLLYAAGGGVVLAISLPYAVRYGYWRSILWSPTWFIFAFLRRLATLEAAISLPVRPFPARAPVGARREPAAARPASVLLGPVPPDRDWPDAGWDRPGPDGLRRDDPGQGGPEEDPVPIPTRLIPSRPRLLLPEADWRPGDG